MYQRLMVPLDGSPLSEAALPAACALAQQSGAAIRLAHVHMPDALNPIYVEGLPVIDQQLHSLARDHERAYLEGVSERLPAGWIADCVVLDPPALQSRAEAVAAARAADAVEAPADLIVMTTHGRGGLARFWLGSVASAIAQVSDVPVLFVRPGDRTLEPGSPPASLHILMPLDGSPLGEQIIGPALELGRATHAAYTLLQVVKPTTLLRAGAFTTATDLDPDATQERVAAAERYLARIKARLAAADAEARAQVCVADRVAAAILSEANLLQADLIALATHGYGGMGRLLLGSIADKLLRGAEVPVLVYRPRAPGVHSGGKHAAADAVPDDANLVLI
jgi:nucleotide-binding universal stress UspA family protein